MVHSCPDLEQYVQFLKLVEEAKADSRADSLTWAIQEAVRRNILRNYLERRGGETLSILMAEYDYATDMAVLKEEAYEDGLFAGLATGREEGISIGLATGREEGISIGLERGLERGLEQGLAQGAYEKALETARNLLLDGFSPEMICKYTSLPIETVQQLIG